MRIYLFVGQKEITGKKSGMGWISKYLLYLFCISNLEASWKG